MKPKKTLSKMHLYYNTNSIINTLLDILKNTCFSIYEKNQFQIDDDFFSKNINPILDIINKTIINIKNENTPNFKEIDY